VISGREKHEYHDMRLCLSSVSTVSFGVGEMGVLGGGVGGEDADLALAVSLLPRLVRTDIFWRRATDEAGLASELALLWLVVAEWKEALALPWLVTRYIGGETDVVTVLVELVDLFESLLSRALMLPLLLR
jgi:hypothetical protein